MSELIQQILSSDDEEDEAFFFIRRPRVVLERQDFLNMYSEQEFKKRFRLSKSSEEIEDMIDFGNDRNNAVQPLHQLLLTLRYYATSAFSLQLADYAGVSKSTANRITTRVSKALCSLKNKYIRFPTTEREVMSTQLLNYNVSSFPRVLAMIDCTHIRISSPGGHLAEQFRNRKGYFSLNTQVMCNADLQITDLVVRWPGSAHDSTIFNACYRKAMFEDGRYGFSILLGDSGYSISPYLMTPLESPMLREEKLYNESHIRTRNCIERLFGVWKRRFPVMAIGLNLELENIFPVITSTAILHNLLRGVEDDLPQDDPDTAIPLPWNQLLNAGQIVIPSPVIRNQRPGERIRNSLINDYFKRLV